MTVLYDSNFQSKSVVILILLLPLYIIRIIIYNIPYMYYILYCYCIKFVDNTHFMSPSSVGRKKSQDRLRINSMKGRDSKSKE